MRKPWRENPELDRKSQVRQVPKYYRAMLAELLDEPMAREKVLKYLDRFQYDPLIALYVPWCIVHGVMLKKRLSDSGAS